jgi:hypothetical protein
MIGGYVLGGNDPLAYFKPTYEWGWNRICTKPDRWFDAGKKDNEFVPVVKPKAAWETIGIGEIATNICRR